MAPFQSIFRALLAGIFFLIQVPGAYAAESNFWKDRRVEADRRRAGRSETYVASLPPSALSAPLEAIPSALSRGLSSNGVLSSPPTPREGTLSSPAQKTFGWLPAVVAPYGDVRDVYVSPRAGAPLVIHIQDAHEVQEAQKNLSGLVGVLKESREISLVGLEGAVGPFSLDLYRAHPNPEVTRQIAESFLELGYLTGPEVAAVTSAAPPVLWGVEDLSLYRDNIAAFEESERTRQRVQVLTAKLSAASEEARDRIYSPALRKMDDHRQAFHAHRETLATYVDYLWSNSKFDTSPFENIRLLREALRWEGSLDFKTVERERLALVEVLSRNLPEAGLQSLVRRSLDYRAGALSYGDYHRFMRRLCEENGIQLSRYPQLSHYISYVLLAERIDRDELLQELDRLERATENALATIPDQRALVAARRGLTLLDKLTVHGLTALEWQTYLLEKPQLLKIPQTLAGLLGRPVPGGDALTPETLVSFENFCARALDRNGALVKNLLAKMTQDKATTAVLVAGGFHTEGLTQTLRREGVSYAVVTPKISRLPEETRPLDVFARKPMPVEQLLAGDIIHLAYPRLGQTNPDGLSPARDASARQQTAQFLATALEGALMESLSARQVEELQDALRAHGRLHSTQPLDLPGLRAISVTLKTKAGADKELVVVSSQEGETTLLNKLGGAPLYQKNFTVEGNSFTVRIYARDALAPGLGLSLRRLSGRLLSWAQGVLQQTRSLGARIELSWSRAFVATRHFGQSLSVWGLGLFSPRAALRARLAAARAAEERDINIASISPEFAPPHTDINDQVRTLKEMGHSVFKFTAEGWSSEVTGFELTEEDRSLLDKAAQEKWTPQQGVQVPLLQGIEVHVVGLPVHPFLHVGPWGAQRAHAGGISTAGSTHPTKRIWIPRGLWEADQAAALKYVFHEAVELNRWFEKAKQLLDEEHIRPLGEPNKISKRKKISGYEKLPTFREWVGANYEEALLQQKKAHTEADRLYTVNGDDLVPYSYYGRTLKKEVVLVAWEDKDYWKRGGLGDVIGEATPTMVATGEKVVKFLPAHRNRLVEGEDTGLTVTVGPSSDQVVFRILKHVPNDGETVYFLEDTRINDPHRFFPGEYYLGDEESKLRESAYFSRAVVAAMRALAIQPSAVNAHDWQTALVLAFLRADDETQKDRYFHKTGRLFTIHNMGRNFFSRNYFHILQGLGLPESFSKFYPTAPLEFNDQIDLLKGALDFRASDFINTVSPQYMLETLTPEGGQGLHGVLATRVKDYMGVLNGLDRDYWNPRRNPLRRGYPYQFKKYSPFTAFETKRTNKIRFQKKLGLPEDGAAPLMEFTARVTVQKGIHWVKDAMEQILLDHPKAQFVYVGDLNKGEPLSQDFVDWMQSLEKDPRFQVDGKSRVKYLPFSGNAKLEFYLKAASDFTLAPSVYEPAGLADKKGMLLGSVAVVNATGGLRFVIDPSEDPERSTGFKMKEPTAASFQETLNAALVTYETQPEVYQQIQKRGMDAPRSWESVSLEYLELYLAAQVKRSRMNHQTNLIEIASDTGHYIGEMPQNLDLWKWPLKGSQDVRNGLNELQRWLAQKIDFPPSFANADERDRFVKQLERYAQVAETLSDVGNFDSNAMEKEFGTRGMGFGLPAQNGTPVGRLGLSQDFFLEGSLLKQHRLAALFHEVVHIARAGEADASQIHEDAVRQYLILFGGLSAVDVRKMDLPALEKHPANALGRDMRVAWMARTLRDENIVRLTTSLKAVLHTPDQLMRYLNEANAALQVAVPLSAEELARRTTELTSRMHSIDGEKQNESPEVLARRRFKAERALLDWSRPLYEVGPVESLHPLLKTIALLSKSDEDLLMGTLRRAVEQDPGLRSRPLLDAILLMGDSSPPSDWAKVQGLSYDRIYHISAEGRPLWRGGLGPVQTFHSDAETELLGRAVDNVDIEMDYEYFRGADGQLRPMDDNHFSTPITVDESKTFLLSLPFHEDVLQLRVRVGEGPKGNPVYLIREIRDGASKFTKTIYDYDHWDNKITKEDFNAFLGAATLAVIAHLEEKRHSDQGPDWKPPVIHTNDAQTSMVNVLLSQVDNPANNWTPKLKASFPFLSRLRRDALRVMTTHTYFNRQVVSKDAHGRNAVGFMSGIQDAQEQDRVFGRGDVLDYTSGALNTAQGRTAVTRKHAWDVMRDYNSGMPITGVTNGMSTEWATKYFHQILTTLHGASVDAHRPDPGFLPLAKQAAKKAFFETLIREQGTMDPYAFERFQRIVPQDAAGQIQSDFLDRPTVGTVVRLVPEKFNVDRAWTDDNIRSLIEGGVNVVILGAVQATDNRSTERQYKLSQLQNDLDRTWTPGQGRFVFLPAFSSAVKQKALGALDILVLDSDEDTEANGYTEVPGSAYGALILAPPFFNGEGLLRGQGMPVNFDQPGEGNTLVPDNINPSSYLKILRRAIDLYKKDREAFATYQAASIRLSRILDARITAAAYLREFNHVYQQPTPTAVVLTKPSVISVAQKVQGTSAPLSLKVYLRPGMSVAELQAQALLSRVTNWGGEWLDKQVIPLSYEKTEKTAEGIFAVFSAQASLAPGLYEWFGETKSPQSPWLMVEGIFNGNNAKLDVRPQEASTPHSALDPMLRAGVRGLDRLGMVTAGRLLDTVRRGWNVSLGPILETAAYPFLLGTALFGAGPLMLFGFALLPVVDVLMVLVFDVMLGRAPPAEAFKGMKTRLIAMSLFAFPFALELLIALSLGVPVPQIHVFDFGGASVPITWAFSTSALFHILANTTQKLFNPTAPVSKNGAPTAFAQLQSPGLMREVDIPSIDALKNAIAGGPVQSQLKFDEFVMGVEALRNSLNGGRQKAKDERDALMKKLNIPVADQKFYAVLGETLGRLHAEGETVGSSSREDIESLLRAGTMMAIEGRENLNPRRYRSALIPIKELNDALSILTNAYHRGQGMVSAEGRALAAWERNHRVGVEISSQLWAGEVSSEKDKTAQMILGTLARVEKNKQGVLDLILPEGADPRGIASFLQRIGAGAIATAHGVMKADVLENEKHSVAKFLCVSQNKQNDFSSVELFLLDPNEWVVEDSVKNLVKLLILLAGDLAVDLTDRLGQEVQHLNIIRLNA